MYTIKNILLILALVAFSSLVIAQEWGYDDVVEDSTQGSGRTPQSLSPAPDSLKIGVFFIQFDDWQTNLAARGSVKEINGSDTVYYPYSEYQEMYFSEDTYVSEDRNPNTPNNPSSSDGKAVFGSFLDYWDEVSYGRFHLAEGSRIVNPYTITAQGDTLLEWLTAPQSKHHYINNQYYSLSRNQLVDAAKDSA